MTISDEEELLELFDEEVRISTRTTRANGSVRYLVRTEDGQEMIDSDLNETAHEYYVERKGHEPKPLQGTEDKGERERRTLAIGMAKKAANKLQTKFSKAIAKNKMERLVGTEKWRYNFGQWVIDRLTPYFQESEIEWAPEAALEKIEGGERLNRLRAIEMFIRVLNYYSTDGAEKIVQLKRENELLKMRIRELKEKQRRTPRGGGARGLRNDIVDLLAQRLDLPQRRVQDLLTELFKYEEGF